MNDNIFEAEKIAGKFILNPLQVIKPQQYLPQRPHIDTIIDGQLPNVKLIPCF